MDSDEEFQFESDDDGWGDQQEEDEETIKIENTFYEADDNKRHDPQKALSQFYEVVSAEKARGDEINYRFKALQNIVILCCRLGRLDEMAQQYQELLALMDKVTRNDASDAINTILDSVSGSGASASGGAAGSGDLSKLERVYALTLTRLKQNTSNQRLWFNTSVKLAKLYLDTQEFGKLQTLIRDLHKSCTTPDGADDTSKGSALLEIYALEIQLCTVTKNSLRMKEIYPKTINLTSAIADPRNVAVIRESGGKMYMSEKKWQSAYNEFFEAFKNYQETGSGRARIMLKYVVLANMLACMDINPFDSREAKVYQEDPEIKAMSELRQAFDNNDVSTIDKLLTSSRAGILRDPLIKEYLEDLLRNIRLQVLKKLVAPYRTAGIDYLSKELNVPKDEVISLLVQLILDEKINGGIDATGGYLQMYTESSSNHMRYSKCKQWVETLQKINNSLNSRLTNMAGAR